MAEFEKWLERHKKLLFKPNQYTLASVHDAWNDSEPHWRKQERERIVDVLRDYARLHVSTDIAKRNLNFIGVIIDNIADKIDREA